MMAKPEALGVGTTSVELEISGTKQFGIVMRSSWKVRNMRDA